MAEQIGSIFVPYVGPKDAKIVFVGEAPGEEEVRAKEPFVGKSGEKLTTCLSRNGLSRSEVCLANLCSYRPPRNDFRSLLGSQQLTDGLVTLYQYLRDHRPTVVCALGNWPLFYLTGKFGKTPGSGILNWRGSVLLSNVSGLTDCKVIPTVHPAAILRDGNLYPTFDQDIKRVKYDSDFPELRLPQRTHVVVKTGDDADRWASKLLEAERLAVDIETFGTSLACVGFSPSPDLGVCFVWSDDFLVRDAVIRLLQSSIPKITHFGTFDIEFLRNLCDIDIVNWKHDTMINQHVMEPSLPRSLAFLTSIYTREPYYKNERKEGSPDRKSWGKKVDREKLWIYNCKDCCVTYEVFTKQEVELKEGPENWRDYVEFEMEELEVASEITRTGMLRDEERRKAIESALAVELREREEGLILCSHVPINAGSHKQVQRLLYDVLKLPTHRNRKTGKLTADADALVSLLGFCIGKIEEVKKKETKDEWTRKALIVKLIMLVRQTRKLLSSYVLVGCSNDGRIRGIYKVPGTDTGRWSAEAFLDDTGCNPQTFPREPIEVDEELWKRLISVGVDRPTIDPGLRAKLQERSDGVDGNGEDSDEVDDSQPAGEGTA